MESILQLLNCCCNKTFYQMIWKLWYFLFFIHFSLTANKSQRVAPYFSQRYRAIKWEKLASTEKNSHLKFQAMCCHAILTTICGRYFSDLIPAAPQPHHCTQTFLTGGLGGAGGEEYFPCLNFEYCHFMYWAVGHVPVSGWYLIHLYVVCHHFTFSYVAFSRPCCLSDFYPNRASLIG